MLNIYGQKEAVRLITADREGLKKPEGLLLSISYSYAEK
jgi:hypothetical protein